MTETSSILPGTLDMLVLKVLSLEPMHGWGIGERIQQCSREVFLVNQGTLYPTLERLQQRGWIINDWRITENNRRARYYTLTPLGATQLREARRSWSRASGAVNWILQTR
ncbi:MAG: PadR family transcriptional regulator [Gemmatimonadaceae bacterium]